MARTMLYFSVDVDIFNGGLSLVLLLASRYTLDQGSFL